MKGPLIGLCGPGGVGKTTVANALSAAWIADPYFRALNLAPAIIAIGEPLKDMLAALLRHAGMTDAQVHRAIYGDGKRLPCAALMGKTPTQAMQTLGTEWGRDCICPDLWLSIWANRARRARLEGRLVINDSVRFENEVDEIRRAGGLVVRLEGRAGDLPASHISERPVSADIIVRNDPGPHGPDGAAQAIVAQILERGGRPPSWRDCTTSPFPSLARVE